MIRSFLLSLLLIALPAFAQQGAIITALQGDVSVVREESPARPAAAFQRLNEADRLELRANSLVQVVYFQSGRQESWRGPARLEVGERESKALSGGEPAQVRALPPMLVRQLVKTPTADASGRIGAVRMRSIVPPDAAKKLEQNYAELKAQAPAGDWNAELYLLAGLYELKEFGRMQALLAQWKEAAPDDPGLEALRQHFLRAINETKGAN